MKKLRNIVLTALAAAAVCAFASCSNDNEIDATIVGDETKGASYSYYCDASGTFTVTPYTSTWDAESSSTVYTADTANATTYDAEYAIVSYDTDPDTNYTWYTIEVRGPESNKDDGDEGNATLYVVKVGSTYYYSASRSSTPDTSAAKVTFSSGTPESSSFTFSYTTPAPTSYYDDQYTFTGVTITRP